MSRTMPNAYDEPEYTKISQRQYKETETFGHLEEGLKNISDAWYSLYMAMKSSVYFEEDEDDVEKMRDALDKMEKELRRILERRGF